MSTVQVSTIVKLETITLKIVAEVAFDSSKGLYIEYWEAIKFVPRPANLRKDLPDCTQTIAFDLGTLQYDDFVTVSEELKQLCDHALTCEAMYADFEDMHINRFVLNAAEENYSTGEGA